jgi:hypothetical protein
MRRDSSYYISRTLEKSVTIALWAAVLSATVAAIIHAASMILMIVVTFGMACDSGCTIWTLPGILGLYSLAVLAPVAALTLLVWHLDHSLYRWIAPVFLAGAMAATPFRIRHHWFWWLDCWDLPLGMCLLQS